MHELLRSMQGQGNLIPPDAPMVIPPCKAITMMVEMRLKAKGLGYQQYSREDDPQEREVRVYTSTNYASDQYTEGPFNFPLEYSPGNPPRRSIGVFDRISPGAA